MLKAAYGLFCTRGYAGTTMDAIAADAGVAVQTIYFTFHTKTAILEEVVGAAIIGFDRWTPIPGPVRAGDEEQIRAHHQWFAAFEAEKDPRRALEIFIDSGVEIMQRMAPMSAVLRAAAAADDSARAVADLGEGRRVESFRAFLAALARKNGLRRGLTLARATDILLTLYSAELFQMLTAERGWSLAEYRQWLLDVLGQQLLPTAP
jgi:AcrR family transcriptional regulator